VLVLGLRSANNSPTGEAISKLDVTEKNGGKIITTIPHKIQNT
jgi:hypothetical protein